MTDAQKALDAFENIAFIHWPVSATDTIHRALRVLHALESGELVKDHSSLSHDESDLATGFNACLTRLQHIANGENDAQ